MKARRDAIPLSRAQAAEGRVAAARGYVGAVSLELRGLSAWRDQNGRGANATRQQRVVCDDVGIVGDTSAVPHRSERPRRRALHGCSSVTTDGY